MKQYSPVPIDTSNIVLPDDIVQLAELLAKNCHDTWAVQRMIQGWTYGPERNDAKKETPCLVEYEDLPESEKEYDRNTSFETLKLIMRFGYKIQKP